MPPELTAEQVLPALQARADGVTIAVRVVPRAPRTELVGRHGRALRCKVHAPPVDGAANDAVRALVADRLGRRPAEIQLLQGHRSRDKVLFVADVDIAEVATALAVP
jgi:uncharacterized protein